ncbi:MAG: alpha/beta hydrolase [Candidatus Obscuribacterales bacterium]|nr:alpha/beta hydrolase [Candidatus Obscuribacterales bacterium]
MTANSFIDGLSMGKPIRLEYLFINEKQLARKPLLIFLHEGLGSVEMWRDFPQQVCESLKLPGLLYSRYGYGRSTQRPTGEIWGSDYLHVQSHLVLPELMQLLHLQDEKPILVGHSDGASIALLYASRFPDNVSGVVAMAPHIFVEDVTIAGIKKMRDVYLQSNMKQKLARYHEDPDSAFWAWNDSWLQPDFINWNIECELLAIKCPLLCVQGYDDEYATMRQLDGIKKLVPHANLLKLSDCGHSPQRDQPDVVIEAIAKFVFDLI